MLAGIFFSVGLYTASRLVTGVNGFRWDGWMWKLGS